MKGLFKFLWVFFGFYGKISCQNPTILDAVFLEPIKLLRYSVMRGNYDTVGNKHRFQRQINPLEPFPCPTKDFRSSTIPQSVHKLKPGDIDIIGAIGDSITSGFGIAASNFVNILSENRGMVYSIGGQENWRKFMTLPNILKLYNPNLFGYSLGPSLSADRASQFNPAENGAISENIPYMTKVLITRIKKDPRTDLLNHWKLITIMIGGNDFCSMICYYKSPEIAVQKHFRDLIRSLRLIRDNLPKTFVNIISPPDVSQLANFTNPPNECQITQRVLCPCFVGNRFKSKANELKRVIKKFQMVGYELAGYEEFNREDFTVVVQPLLSKAKLPIGPDGFTDRSYFSVDCFHFSQKAHAEAAKALWNNIFEPINEKLPDLFVNKLKCPTKDRPYLATSKNNVSK